MINMYVRILHDRSNDAPMFSLLINSCRNFLWKFRETSIVFDESAHPGWLPNYFLISPWHKMEIWKVKSSQPQPTRLVSLIISPHHQDKQYLELKQGVAWQLRLSHLSSCFGHHDLLMCNGSLVRGAENLKCCMYGRDVPNGPTKHICWMPPLQQLPRSNHLWQLDGDVLIGIYNCVDSQNSSQFLWAPIKCHISATHPHPPCLLPHQPCLQDGWWVYIGHQPQCRPGKNHQTSPDFDCRNDWFCSWTGPRPTVWEQQGRVNQGGGQIPGKSWFWMVKCASFTNLLDVPPFLLGTNFHESCETYS